MKRLLLRRLGTCAYGPAWRAMQRFTVTRTPETPDEIWLLEHPPVYTAGVRGRRQNSTGMRPGTTQPSIPFVHTDRGGLTTYHGPGQLIAYTLIDLGRAGIGVRGLVNALENAVITLLRQYGFRASPRRDAPGVYVNGAKIASLGLRVRRLRSYHGLSLNVDADLAPFDAIVPCGQPGLEVTSLAKLGVDVRVHEVAIPLLGCLMDRLGYREISAHYTELPHEAKEHEQPA